MMNYLTFRACVLKQFIPVICVSVLQWLVYRLVSSAMEQARPVRIQMLCAFKTFALASLTFTTKMDNAVSTAIIADWNLLTYLTTHFY